MECGEEKVRIYPLKGERGTYRDWVPLQTSYQKKREAFIHFWVNFGLFLTWYEDMFPIPSVTVIEYRYIMWYFLPLIPYVVNLFPKPLP